MKCKQVVSCTLAVVMAMQGGGMVFAGGNASNESQLSVVSEQNQYTQFLNSMIADGYLKVDSNNELLVTQKYVDYVQNKLKSTNLKAVNGKKAIVYADKNAIVIKSGCSNEDIGETKFVPTWKGFDIYLDHRICSSIVKAEESSIAIYGILALVIPEAAPIAGIADAILGFGKMILDRQDLGRGVILAFIEPCILHWVSSQ